MHRCRSSGFSAVRDMMGSQMIVQKFGLPDMLQSECLVLGSKATTGQLFIFATILEQASNFRFWSQDFYSITPHR